MDKDLNIFDGISAYPLILTYRKNKNPKDYIFSYKDATQIKINNLNEIVQDVVFDKISIKNFISNDFKFLTNIVSKIVTSTVILVSCLS